MKIRKNGRVVNLTESDLRRITKRFLIEQDDQKSGTEEEMFGLPVSKIDRVAEEIVDRVKISEAIDNQTIKLYFDLKRFMESEGKKDDKGNMSYGPMTRNTVWQFEKKNDSSQSFFDEDKSGFNGRLWERI